MTDSPHPDDLQRLDTTARHAADQLRRHVDQHLDVDLALAAAPSTATPRARHRVMALAAVVALLAGSLALISANDDDGRNRLELDEDGNLLPDPRPGVLTPLGPRDGKDSIQLPVTVEPNRDLPDGTVVTVTGEGFVPGERVGIVQCAREAGGDTPETRGGVDGCDVGGVQYADADADGVATGTIAVRRVLTTPLTGTVDCAAEAERCLVAMGALNDYDRSGGLGVEVRGGGEPIAIPEVTVSPAEGLRDGDVVEVRGEDLTPNDELSFSVCSSDPAMCWGTGTASGPTVRVDGDGRFAAQVPVWQYLPGDYEQPGTYIDCSVSRCTLRIQGQSTPPPVFLSFVAGGDGPTPPAVAVEPAEGLAPGDTIVMRGVGFPQRAEAGFSLCSFPGGSAETYEYGTCIGFEMAGPVRVDDDGRFAVETTVPDPTDWFVGGMETCDDTGTCRPMTDEEAAEQFRCDGVISSCHLRIDAFFSDEVAGQRPFFAPAPVLITFR